jgi:hypothetical protein
MPIVDAGAPGARTTVFCAAWSGDPDRHALLRAHQACLDAQTVPVVPLVVLDDGDEPPGWLRGVVVTSRRPLALYEAWSVATQLAGTPYLMNLNLDDRLAADAVEVMERALDEGADLVGGDWRVCHDQAATDAVAGTPAVPAHDLPFAAGWPPAPGVETRLGSGTGDRGTYGPATMWRRSLHERARYPWAFADGSPIRVVGDLAWWLAVTGPLGGRAARLPLVVGHYRSHPSGQAEFRHADEHDRLAAGVSTRPAPLDGVAVTGRPSRAPTGPAMAPSQVTVDRFTSFKDRHRGEACVVMGNGPSLNQMDLDLLEGEVVFGSNAAYLLYDRVRWRHRYYFACDSRVVPDHAEQLVAVHEANPDIEFFFPAVLHLWDGSGDVVPTERYIPRAPGRWFFRPIPQASYNLPFTAVSADMDQGLIMPFTVTINMIEAAAYMGFTTIVLIGCDTTYVVPDDVVAEGPEVGGARSLLTSTSADPNHFSPDYFGPGRRWHQPHPDRMVQHYRWAKEAFAYRGVQILNATVGGALEVFRRVDYASLFTDDGDPPGPG